MSDRGDQRVSIVDTDIVHLLQVLGATPVLVQSRPAVVGAGFDVTIRVMGPFVSGTAADDMAAHVSEQLALLGVPVA